MVMMFVAISQHASSGVDFAYRDLYPQPILQSPFMPIGPKEYCSQTDSDAGSNPACFLYGQSKLEISVTDKFFLKMIFFGRAAKAVYLNLLENNENTIWDGQFSKKVISGQILCTRFLEKERYECQSYFDLRRRAYLQADGNMDAFTSENVGKVLEGYHSHGVIEFAKNLRNQFLGEEGFKIKLLGDFVEKLFKIYHFVPKLEALKYDVNSQITEILGSQQIEIGPFVCFRRLYGDMPPNTQIIQEYCRGLFDQRLGNFVSITDSSYRNFFIGIDLRLTTN